MLKNSLNLKRHFGTPRSPGRELIRLNAWLINKQHFAQFLSVENLNKMYKLFDAICLLNLILPGIFPLIHRLPSVSFAHSFCRGLFTGDFMFGIYLRTNKRNLLLLSANICLIFCNLIYSHSQAGVSLTHFG